MTKSNLSAQLPCVQVNIVLFQLFPGKFGGQFLCGDGRIGFQQAAGVALVAERMALSGSTVSAQDLTPTYLRLSQAERERLEKGLPLTTETK